MRELRPHSHPLNRPQWRRWGILTFSTFAISMFAIAVYFVNSLDAKQQTMLSLLLVKCVCLRTCGVWSGCVCVCVALHSRCVNLGNNIHYDYHPFYEYCMRNVISILKYLFLFIIITRATGEICPIPNAILSIHRKRQTVSHTTFKHVPFAFVCQMQSKEQYTHTHTPNQVEIPELSPSSCLRARIDFMEIK